MSAQILDGRACAAEVKRDVAARVAALEHVPGLATVLVGDDPGSQTYVAGKHRDCAEVGIRSIRHDLPADSSQEDLLSVVDELNSDPDCTAFIVQLPLPKHIDSGAILERMSPEKDADGLHPMNLGRLVLTVNAPMRSPLPCTPLGVIELLRWGGVSLEGKHVVVIGRGVTVGRPIGALLTRREHNATVTLTHTGTSGLAGHVSQADVVIAAAGSAHMVRPEMVKPGAIVLDVGVSRVEPDVPRSEQEKPPAKKARLLGDVHPDVAEVASWISPNPGGVGPMTRALLLRNVVEIAERNAGSVAQS